MLGRIVPVWAGRKLESMRQSTSGAFPRDPVVIRRIIKAIEAKPGGDKSFFRIMERTERYLVRNRDRT